MPIKGFKLAYYPEGSVTQFFGENPSLYRASVCSYGLCLQGHNGIDIVSAWGTPIYAVEEGKVVEVKDSPTGYGRHVRILTEDGKEWTYGHASENLVKQGNFVKKGDLIQKMGNTGFVVSGATPYWKYNPYAGTHLHLGLRKGIKSDTKYNLQYPTGDRVFIDNYDNGFFGSIDPVPRLQELNGSSDSLTEAEKMYFNLTIRSIANTVFEIAQQILLIKKRKWTQN